MLPTLLVVLVIVTVLTALVSAFYYPTLADIIIVKRMGWSNTRKRRIMWLITATIAVVNLACGFTNYSMWCLGLTNGLLLLGIALTWDIFKRYAAKNHPWWSWWAEQKENCFSAITNGGTISHYVMNPTDPDLRKNLEQLRDDPDNPEPYVINKPDQGIITVGPFWQNALKPFAWSEWTEFIDGEVVHSIPFDIQKHTFRQQLEPSARAVLENKVKEARDNHQQMSPSEVEQLLDTTFQLTKDGIAVGIPVEVQYRLIHPRVNCTDGKRPLDIIQNTFLNPALQATTSKLDFLGQDSTDIEIKTVNPELKANVQHFLNIYMGLTTDDREILLPNEETAKLALLTFGIELIRTKVLDVNETSQEITEALQRQAIAETQRQKAKVDADAAALVEIRRSEGERQATINRAEGKKQEEILKAEGKKQSDILDGEGQHGQAVGIAKARRELRDVWKVGEEVTQQTNEDRKVEILAEAWQEGVSHAGQGKVVVVGEPGGSANPIAGAVAALTTIASGVTDTAAKPQKKKGKAGDSPATDEETPPPSGS